LERAALESERVAAKTILLVDDEMLIQMLGSDVLEDAGYRVIAAHDGVQALKALEPGIDLIVTDVMMPRMDGPKWVSRARTEGYADVPVVFTSAVMQPALEREFSRALFLPKPYRPNDLLAAVERLLDGAGSENQNRG
jgi:two-component system cell cycle sensor histidine kinase/response regulator CckA